MALPGLTVHQLRNDPREVARVLHRISLSNRALARLLGTEDRTVRAWRAGETSPDRLPAQLLWLMYVEYEHPTYGGRSFLDRLDALARREREEAALYLLRHGIECLRPAEPPPVRALAETRPPELVSVLAPGIAGFLHRFLSDPAARERVQKVMRELGDAYFDDLEARVRAEGVVPMFSCAE